MRILFVIGNLGDYHVPRYEALVSAASGRGHEVALLEVFARSGVYGFPQERRAAFFANRPHLAETLVEDGADSDGLGARGTARLIAKVRGFMPDVVITLGYNTGYSTVLCVLRHITRRFKLIYMSDSKADDGLRQRAKERLKRFVVSRFDGALVAGEKHRRYAQSLGIPQERSRIGFDVIDVDYFSRLAQTACSNPAAVRSRFGLPQRYLLCVSRFVARKNVDVLIDAYRKSGVYKQNIGLVLVGQGPLEAQLRERITSLGLTTHVTILNSLANQEMPNLYALAEFIVLASEFDQWGLCVNEAFAAGCPAIVTRTCGVAGEVVIDGVNGFVVEPRDVSTLAQRIGQLGGEPALRERFAAGAQSAIRRWTPVLFASSALELAEVTTRNARDPAQHELV
ncbi:glycosyltransferase involved in cell wall biosynthesis [Paraburkholderia unamae]|uniref:glycosyltransferase family 4 protein n=1 Tax=Paraburkholderia unamae TaxID=219649 RepID=UPI000DC4BEED|nr:glycosyltransferase family 4 protein [Paraburkholderia unamae]RAR51554.1 glycosyltransferase involved in cell wall biosynthesis [Paraburkholderia unamae]